MRQGLPQFENVEEKSAAAKAKLDSAIARRDAAMVEGSTARDKANAAVRMRAAENDVLAAAQRDYGAALLANKGTEDAQRRVQESQTKIDSLTNFHAELVKEANRIEGSLSNFLRAVTQAEADFKSAEQNRLIAQYAAALAPLIPIARALHDISPPGQFGERSGYVLNLEEPFIGHYRVNDDGSLHFLLR